MEETKKSKTSHAGLVLGIISAVLVAILAPCFVWLYFFEARNGKQLFYIPMFFLLPLVFVAIILVLIQLVLIFVDAKGKGKLITAIPTFVLVMIVIVSSSICGIHYATADKATYGIPEKEQQILNIDNMVSYALQLKEPQFDINQDYQNHKIDSDHILIKAIADLSIEGPIDPDLLADKKAGDCIRYYLGHDDFYGLTICRNGVIVASDHGDLFSTPYDLYYTFDVSQYSDLNQLALSLK